MDIEERVNRNNTAALKVLESLKTDDDDVAFERDLERYIRLRYLLDDDPFWSDNLAEYTQYSIEKTLKQSSEGTKLRDLGINCAGTSSAMTKRFLLLISLRKGLGIDVDPEAMASVETVGELASLLREALKSNA